MVTYIFVGYFSDVLGHCLDSKCQWAALKDFKSYESTKKAEMYMQQAWHNKTMSISARFVDAQFVIILRQAFLKWCHREKMPMVYFCFQIKIVGENREVDMEPNVYYKWKSSFNLYPMRFKRAWLPTVGPLYNTVFFLASIHKQTPNCSPVRAKFGVSFAFIV